MSASTPVGPQRDYNIFSLIMSQGEKLQNKGEATFAKLPSENQVKAELEAGQQVDVSRISDPKMFAVGVGGSIISGLVVTMLLPTTFIGGVGGLLIGGAVQGLAKAMSKENEKTANAAVAGMSIGATVGSLGGLLTFLMSVQLINKNMEGKNGPASGANPGVAENKTEQ